MLMNGTTCNMYHLLHFFWLSTQPTCLLPMLIFNAQKAKLNPWTSSHLLNLRSAYMYLIQSYM